MKMDVQPKLTLKDRIRYAFVRLNNEWTASGLLPAQIPNSPKQSVYAVVSAMAIKGELEKQTVEHFNVYRLPESVYQNMVNSSMLDTKADSIVEEQAEEKIETQPQPEVEETPKVIEVPEGVKGKRAYLRWTQTEREDIARLFVITQDKKIPMGFADMFWAAQMGLPEERRNRKISLQREVPWLDEEVTKIRNKIRFQEAEREKAECRKQEEEQAKANAVIENLQAVGMDMLMAEVMRRGQSLIETMLINAMTSPKVREALASNLTTELAKQHIVERRHDPRGASEERERLPKLLIFGLNKPIHQNEIRRDFSDRFDLRFLAVKSNPQQAASMAKAAHKVIILSDHVDHTGTDLVIRENKNFERLAGGIGALRDKLNSLEI